MVAMVIQDAEYRRLVILMPLRLALTMHYVNLNRVGDAPTVQLATTIQVLQMTTVLVRTLL